jgi:hypothetical protein
MTYIYQKDTKRYKKIINNISQRLLANNLPPQIAQLTLPFRVSPTVLNSVQTVRPIQFSDEV